ncbi:MAG: hypothetical protein IT453_12575 [Planctomycetes bacterium]|nr:hypothetical protein [Planctomycetota bacterium]
MFAIFPAVQPPRRRQVAWLLILGALWLALGALAWAVALARVLGDGEHELAQRGTTLYWCAAMCSVGLVLATAAGLAGRRLWRPVPESRGPAFAWVALVALAELGAIAFAFWALMMAVLINAG